MKITIVTGPFLPPPPGPAGAVERRWAASATRMAERGHDVSIVCCGLEPGTDRGAEEWVTNPVTYHPIAGFDRSGRTAGDLWRDLIYSRRARKVLPEADVTVVNTFWLPILLPRMRGERHGAVIYNLARYPKAHLRWYRGVDRVLAVSNAVADAARQIEPALSPKICVIPNPIDGEAFTPQAFAGIRDNPRVLYTGRLHPEKGLEILVEACVRLVRAGHPVRLCLRGEARTQRGGGGDAYLEKLRGLAQPLGSSFEIAEPLYDRGALAREIAACDLYVCPSVAERGESFGVAPLEAMAVGRPVIVSALECFQDYARDDENALVFDHRVADPGESLFCAMLRLIETSGLATTLATRAEETARDFRYDAVVERYLELFAQAAAEKRHV